MPKKFFLFALAVLVLAGGCSRLPPTRVTPLKPATIGELQGYFQSHKPDVDQFRLQGPFAVSAHTDFSIQLSAKEHINADLFLSAPAEKAALVIFLHGYASSKDDHSFQAMHLASWGMHSLVLQLPNNGPWDNHGKTVARIINLIKRQPQIIDPRIDTNKIILVGHSFGGSATAVALAEGAPVAGAVLLDPAAAGRNLPGYLRKISTPVMVIGADEFVTTTLNRGFFYRFVRGGISEISIKDASHEDAQYPSHSLQVTEELQITFVSALTASAMSLAATGKLDYAWASFEDAFRDGKFFNERRK